MVGEKCAVKGAGLSRPRTGSPHPMAIEVGCLSARDFPATIRVAPVPLPEG
jgi:hypothetical protein